MTVHIAKNYMELPKIKVPLILGIWGGKGQGKTFQCMLAYKKLGINPIVMSAGTQPPVPAFGPHGVPPFCASMCNWPPGCSPHSGCTTRRPGPTARCVHGFLLGVGVGFGLALLASMDYVFGAWSQLSAVACCACYPAAEGCTAGADAAGPTCPCRLEPRGVSVGEAQSIYRILMCLPSRVQERWSPATPASPRG